MMAFITAMLESEICHRMYCVESQKDNPYAFLVWFVWRQQQVT